MCASDQRPRVIHRIAVDEQQIRSLAGLDRPDIGEPEEPARFAVAARIASSGGVPPLTSAT
jgi:hypothetical protein